MGLRLAIVGHDRSYLHVLAGGGSGARLIEMQKAERHRSEVRKLEQEAAAVGVRRSSEEHSRLLASRACESVSRFNNCKSVTPCQLGHVKIGWLPEKPRLHYPLQRQER